MKLNKTQIRIIELQHSKTLECVETLRSATEILARLISSYTGVQGVCDYGVGDGFGFSVGEAQDQVPIKVLLDLAKAGKSLDTETLKLHTSI